MTATTAGSARGTAKVEEDDAGAVEWVAGRTGTGRDGGDERERGGRGKRTLRCVIASGASAHRRGID